LDDNSNFTDKRKQRLLIYISLTITFTMPISAFMSYKSRFIYVSIVEFSLFISGIILLYFIINNKFIKFSTTFLLTAGYIFMTFMYLENNFHFTVLIFSSLIIGLTFYFLKRKYALPIVILYLTYTILLFTYKFINTQEISSVAFYNITVYLILQTAFIYFYELTRKEAETKLKEEIKVRKEAREELLKEIEIRKKTEIQNRELIEDLKKSMNEIKQLSSFLPICSSCKKVRDDNGYWKKIEHYVSKHSNTEFSHSLCPTCVNKLYPEFADNIEDKDYNNIIKS